MIWSLNELKTNNRPVMEKRGKKFFRTLCKNQGFLSNTPTYACVLSHFSHVWLFATLLTVARQVPLSMGFSRQEYWSGLPCPPAGDLPDPGIELVSLLSPALAGDSLPLAPHGKHISTYMYVKMLVLVTQSCLNCCDPMEPARLLCPWNFLSKNTGAGSHSLLQGSFRLRDQTQFSCTAGRFFTVWYIHVCIGTKLSQRTLSSISTLTVVLCDSPHISVGKESTCNAGDPGSIPGSGRSAREGIGYPLQYSRASLVVQLVKNPPAMQKTWVNPWVGKIPWRRKRLPTPVFLPGEFQGLYSPWGCKESDTTEKISLSLCDSEPDFSTPYFLICHIRITRCALCQFPKMFLYLKHT